MQDTAHEQIRKETWSDPWSRDWFIIEQLVSRDFKLKFRRSFLGVLWSVLNPLLMMVVMAIVFTAMLRFSSSSIPSFPLYIILGNITFTLMADSTTYGMHSIIDNASLIKKVRINRFVFPIEKVLFALVNFSFSLIAVAFVMIFVGIAPTGFALLLPLFIVYVVRSVWVFRFCFRQQLYFLEILCICGPLSLRCGPTLRRFFIQKKFCPCGLEILKPLIPCITTLISSAKFCSTGACLLWSLILPVLFAR